MFLLGFASLLLVNPPQNRQAEVPVGAKGQLDDDPEDHPVVAEAEDFVLFGAEDGIEEDAAEGHLGPSFVGQGIVDDDPKPHSRYQSQDTQQQQATDLIPVPDGLAEQAVGSGMVALFRMAGSFPNPADRAPSQTDDPGGDRQTKGRVHFGAKG